MGNNIHYSEFCPKEHYSLRHCLCRHYSKNQATNSLVRSNLPFFLFTRKQLNNACIDHAHLTLKYNKTHFLVHPIHFDSCNPANPKDTLGRLRFVAARSMLEIQYTVLQLHCNSLYRGSYTTHVVSLLTLLVFPSYPSSKSIQTLIISSIKCLIMQDIYILIRAA